ncbi:hypothetical protein DJ564_17700 [Pseudomonas sp. 31-12]|nr:hypothetical protein DJ564_17700 [Pseudomonas sp. 31-12]
MPGLVSLVRSGLCENVASRGRTRQKIGKKRPGSRPTLRVVNEHSEPVFNAIMPSALVFTHSTPGQDAQEFFAADRLVQSIESA